MGSDRERLILGYEQVEFPSEDGLGITGDLYRSVNEKGFILLCHRSHCNRSEYRETAPRLVSLGFSCLAIDQRSGMKIFGETNETSRRAKERGLPTGYLDARADIDSAIEYCYELNGRKPILLLGSSYSASLALICSVGNNMVQSVLVFSPGEHLKKVSVRDSIKDIKIPIFVTSAKAEVSETSVLVDLVDKKFVTQYVPTIEGFHGSKTLWRDVPGSQEYWKALEDYLDKLSGKSSNI